MEKNNLALPIAIVLAGALVAGVMFYNNKNVPATPVGQQNTGTNSEAKIVSDFSVAVPESKDSIVGNINADVVLIEYSDTECPFCKVFHETMQKVITKYSGDQVAWVYRYMPLDVLHKKARKEAVAVECAKTQGGNDVFWKYLNALMSQTNSNDSLPETALPQIAKSLKLDMTKWNKCYANNESIGVIQANEQTGKDAGVQGTPNNFLIFKKALSKDTVANISKAFAQFPEGTIRISTDGKIVNLGGAMPYDLLTFVIDAGLASK